MFDLFDFVTRRENQGIVVDESRCALVDFKRNGKCNGESLPAEQDDVSYIDTATAAGMMDQYE